MFRKYSRTKLAIHALRDKCLTLAVALHGRTSDLGREMVIGVDGSFDLGRGMKE